MTTSSGSASSASISCGESRLPVGLFGEARKIGLARPALPSRSRRGRARRTPARGMSITRPPAISVEKGYMPNVGGQLMTASPGEMVARRRRSMRSSLPRPQTMLFDVSADVARDRLARGALVGVGVDVVRGLGADGLERLRRRAVRVLVAVELDDGVAGDAEALGEHVGRLDRHVAGEVEQVRADEGAEIEVLHAASDRRRRCSDEASAPSRALRWTRAEASSLRPLVRQRRSDAGVAAGTVAPGPGAAEHGGVAHGALLSAQRDAHAAFGRWLRV